MTIEDRAAAPDLLADLNPVQREAVESPGGPLLLLAGAGSGKTRVLTRRIAELIRRRGVSPARILAVTFTNKAAGEMRGRIESLLGQPTSGLWIGTFHSICLRLLKRHATVAGYAPNLSVFDDEDQLALLRRLLKEEGLENRPRRARETRSIISRAKSRGLGPEEFRRDSPAPAAQLAARIYAAYQQELRRQNAVDFDDLLMEAERLLREQSAIAEQYAEQFQHVLVDEFQDTNHIQYRLVERLARHHRNIFVVGDDDQSIYGWRGADIRNILDFQRHFPDASVLYMEQNYRSTQAILDFANAAIARNEGRWPKRLWTERAAGDLPELFLGADEDEEAAEVARRIARHLAQGGERREVAIFYRTHAQSRPLEDALLRARIPYVLVGGVYFYQRREVKDLLSYLRLLVNPRDETSLRRALSAPRRGVGERTTVALLAAARAAAADPLDLAAAGFDGARGRGRVRLQEFAAMMLELRGRVSEPPEAILSEIIRRVDYSGYLEGQGGDWEERHANVIELVEGARLFSSAADDATPSGVAAYLDQVSLLTSMDRMERGSDVVTLMTAHNAKGLEFPLVFVTGLEEGLFPHVSAFDDDEELEEERRLFYVACTRAMRRLMLSASLLRRRFSGVGGGVSRFLSEVPPELYHESDGEGGDWAWQAARRARDGAVTAGAVLGRPRQGDAGRSPPGAPAQGSPGAGSPAMEPGGDPFDHPLVGRRVFHAAFGPGLVTGADGEGPQARITVRFHSGETRKVVRSYLEWES